MSIAIATSNGTFIYFDAVLSYSENYSNSVSKHPVDGGGNISDHVTMENPCFSISGVISSVDFNDTRPLVDNPNGGGKITFKNVNPIFSSVSVRDNDKDLFRSLPFISGLQKTAPKPTINMDGNTATSLELVKEVLKSLRDNNANANSNYGLFSVYEFNNGLISSTPKDSCVLVGLDFNETPDTGDCLDVSLKIEQVTFVTLSKTEFSRKVSSGTKDSANSKSDKGSKGDTPTTEIPPLIKRKSLAAQALDDGVEVVDKFLNQRK